MTHRLTLIRFLGSENLCQPSVRRASAQGSPQGGRAIADGAARGADQPPVPSYVGMLSWLRSSMGKLKAVAELFEGRLFDREVFIL
jgi:hypothetical protein